MSDTNLWRQDRDEPERPSEELPPPHASSEAHIAEKVREAREALRKGEG